MKTPKQRFRDFYLRQLDKGLRVVHVWIPKEKVSILKDFAKSLRDKK